MFKCGFVEDSLQPETSSALCLKALRTESENHQFTDVSCGDNGVPVGRMFIFAEGTQRYVCFRLAVTSVHVAPF